MSGPSTSSGRGLRATALLLSRRRFSARVLLRLLRLHESGQISRARLWRLWRAVLTEGYRR